MIKTKIIASEHLFDIFKNQYLIRAKNKTDLNYLKNSQVRIFYRDNEEHMIAGFCINSGPEYRTFLPLSTEQLKNLYTNNYFDKVPPHEISCLWIEKNNKSSKWTILVYWMMFMDMCRVRSGNFIFGTHSKNIKYYFSGAFPDVIFYQKLFVRTKGKECDFWIMKGSKFTFFKSFFLLASILFFSNKKKLARFRMSLKNK